MSAVDDLLTAADEFKRSKTRVDVLQSDLSDAQLRVQTVKSQLDQEKLELAAAKAALKEAAVAL